MDHIQHHVHLIPATVAKHKKRIPQNLCYKSFSNLPSSGFTDTCSPGHQAETLNAIVATDHI